MTNQEAKDSLNKIIDKARVHLYKPIQMYQIFKELKDGRKKDCADAKHGRVFREGRKDRWKHDHPVKCSPTLVLEWRVEPIRACHARNCKRRTMQVPLRS